MQLQPFVMHEAGSIGGVPNPDHQSGIWPGGITVWVDLDTMEVDHVSLIGGNAPTAEESDEDLPQVTPVAIEEHVNVI